MTHELILDIEPTGVKCIPVILEFVGCNNVRMTSVEQVCNLLGSVGEHHWQPCRVSVKVLCQRRCGSMQHILASVGATVTRWQALLSLKHQVHSLSTHVSNSTLSY